MALNKWDDRDKFQYVYFALEDATQTWSENRETSSFTTWDIFKTELLRTFTCMGRKQGARMLLQTRQQHPNESVTVLMKEMAQLFRRADPSMPESRKVRLCRT